MNLHTLKAFRHAILGCFGSAKDALFNTMDAILSEGRAHSFPELSLSSAFKRHWPSLYEAFKDGHIGEARLRKVFVSFLPQPPPEHPLWIGIDTSGFARPRSSTASDRSAQFVHNLPECEKPGTY
ncbi:MAG TPA: transposase [Ktedonobacteraceae bacterium]|nr:transposase [Ktedonobacteraceae bacterium]